ncbi:hypothetical protein Golob_024441, partial [Gossypium lobatum]|nr:hypothetical protein [Gossypium lobatum]
MSIDDINTSFNPINLYHIFVDVDRLIRLTSREKESIVSGENVDSGGRHNGGGLSPIGDDDGHSGDRGEIRSSSQYGGECEIGDPVLITLNIVIHPLTLK